MFTKSQSLVESGKVFTDELLPADGRVTGLTTVASAKKKKQQQNPNCS